jgi:hypothetical protein
MKPTNNGESQNQQALGMSGEIFNEHGRVFSLLNAGPTNGPVISTIRGGVEKIGEAFIDGGTFVANGASTVVESVGDHKALTGFVAMAAFSALAPNALAGAANPAGTEVNVIHQGETESGDAQNIAKATGQSYLSVLGEIEADNTNLNPHDLHIGGDIVEPVISPAGNSAVTEAAAVAPDNAANATTTITVTPGLTMWGEAGTLSAQLGQSQTVVTSRIEQLNTEDSPTDLHIGSLLVIPTGGVNTAVAAPAPSTPDNAANAVVPVKSGLTFSAVASAVAPITGETVTQEVNTIEAANPTLVPNDLQPNKQQIVVPAANPTQATSMEAAASTIPVVAPVTAPAAAAPSSTAPPATPTPGTEYSANSLFEGGPQNTPTGLELWNENSVVLSHSGFSALQLDQMFVNTPFAYVNGGTDWGEVFYQFEQQTGISALFAAAHAAEESDWGQSYFARTRNNLFGIGAYTSDPDMAFSYSSVGACMSAYGQILIANYLTPGGEYYSGTTIHDIFVHYSTSDTPANELAGLAEDQTISKIINNFIAVAQANNIQPNSAPAPASATVSTPTALPAAPVASTPTPTVSPVVPAASAQTPPASVTNNNTFPSFSKNTTQNVIPSLQKIAIKKLAAAGN